VQPTYTPEDYKMEPFRVDFLVLALNTTLIALILTASLLVGLLIIRVLRKGVSEDRRIFEEDIRSKLGEIAELQKEVVKQLNESLKRSV
jgi:hypothetical protein